MLKHEFYADPTVFDQWQNTTGNWLCSRLSRLHPYAWGIAFLALAVTFLCIALSVLAFWLHQSLSGESALAWNRSLAQGVTVIVSLVAAQSLLTHATHAWPDATRLPYRLRMLAGFVACTSEARPAPLPTSAPQQGTQTKRSLDPKVIQEFFTGVRAAGVNVAIAKALFAAGIRSAHHLQAAGDNDLLRIRGVGPATVSKLRAQFVQR